MMIRSFLLGVLFSTISLSSGTYVVHFPNTLVPGIPLKIRVLVQGSSGPVSLTTSLKYVQNNTVITQNTTIAQDGLPSTLTVNVPESLMPSTYNVTVLGSGGLTFHNESRIHFDNKRLLMFIQTDKSRYSAGQLVKYRAIFLLPNLLNYKGKATVTIKDGKNNRIDILGPSQVRNGVLSGQIQLSKEPVFGDWTIVVEALGKTAKKVFGVNDYVLPKFNVQMLLPDQINSTQDTFKVEVRAKFTFNADVLGNCSVLFYNLEQTWKNFELKQEFKGSAVFEVSMSRLISELDADKFSQIKIRATVMDHATALTMVSERPLNIVYLDNQNRVSIIHIDHYKHGFVPGMTYNTRLLVEVDNKPIGRTGYLTVIPTVTTADLKMCYKVNPPKQWLDVREIAHSSMRIKFDESGYANLSYSVSSQSAQKLVFVVKYSDPSGQGTEVITITLYAVHINHMPLLRLQSEKSKVVAGDTVSLKVTSANEINGHLTFEVYSRGILLQSENVAVRQEKSKTYSITVTKDMIPRAYIVVYHLTITGSLIADFVFLDVKGFPLHNKVRASYNSTEMQPGQTANLHISADPYSTVFVLTEDERNTIIGTENDIFKTDVVSELETTSYRPDEHVRKGQNSYRRKRQEDKKTNQHFRRAHGELGDTDDIYVESGLVVLSDAKVLEYSKNDLLLSKSYMRECEAPQQLKVYPYPSMYAFPNAIIPPNPGGLSLSEIVRSRFPETWMWEEVAVGSSGEINITKIVPDSMTSWITSVFAVNPHTGFGIADIKPKLTVKKDFFVTMDLPQSIVHGEEFLLQITVFNYLLKQQQVFLQVMLSDDPENPIPAATTVIAGQGHSTYVHVTPKSIGTLNILVMAKTGFFATSVSDSMSKNVTVRPHGVFKSTNEQHLVDVSKNSRSFTKTVYLKDPHDMVSGTKSMKLSITGNFMIPSIEGLHELIRMPYGCGEQNMLHFAPDIYITKYLKVVGKLTTEVEEKSSETLKDGLQRELSYQHNDGSFSAFGNKDPSGSSWLTSFVLKCFRQAEGLIEIDDEIMSRAMNWLLQLQQNDGSFSEPGRVIHTQMQAGTASGMKLTAFILISVLENRNMKGVAASKLTNAITRGKRYLERDLHTADDAYTLALVCYALANAGSSSDSTCFTKLKNAALIADDKTFWKANSPISKRETVQRAAATRAPSADIEASAYALLTFMKLGRTSEAFPIVKWLASQRNPSGGFQSTQDTIISLQALSEFSSTQASGPKPDYGVQFNIYGMSFSHTYSTTPETIDVVHSKEIPNSLDNVMLQVVGEGSAVIDLTMSYYVTGNEANDHIGVTVSLSKETINSITVKACLSWKGNAQSGMLVMEVEMPTGFQADADKLKSTNVIKRYETNGKNIALYFDGINPNSEMCVEVKMDRRDPVVKSQACHVTVYDYYEPTHQAMTRYESGVLKSSNICSVCPQCSFCTGVGGVNQIGVGK